MRKASRVCVGDRAAGTVLVASLLTIATAVSYAAGTPRFLNPFNPFGITNTGAYSTPVLVDIDLILKGDRIGGSSSQMPALPLRDAATVVAQVVNSDGGCWEARFTGAHILANEQGVFKARRK